VEAIAVAGAHGAEDAAQRWLGEIRHVRPAITGDDLLEVAGQAEDMFQSTCLTPQTAASIRGLADLAPERLAIMHGSSFEGDGGAALRALADEYERRLLTGMGTGVPA
jgi:hypothetical protein